MYRLGEHFKLDLTKAVSNKENVIDQLKLSIEYISSFCYELTKHFENVYLASASGNHSRLQAKDLAQHSERLDAFIAWDVCRTLQNQKNFHSLLDCSIDDGIAMIDIESKSYMLIHGDFDSTNKQGYMKHILSSTDKINASIVFKCVDSDLFCQVIKHYFNLPVAKSDLVFDYKGSVACFLQPIPNPFLCNEDESERLYNEDKS